MNNKFELLNTELNWEEEKMDDGETWFRTTISNLPEDSIITNGSIAVVTAEGRTLLDKDTSLFKKLLVFKRASNEHKSKDHVRKILGSQGNGSVYALGTSGIAIKEASSSHSVHLAAERMDKLYRLIENSLKTKTIPEWIGLPKHYGYLIPPITAINKRQYLMMEQIDAGVTIEDVLSIFDRGEESRKIVEKRFGHTLSEMDVAEIKNQYIQLRKILENIISKSNESLDHDHKKTFKEWMPDFHEGNILVDRIDPPLEGKRFKLWIIDQ